MDDIKCPACGHPETEHRHEDQGGGCRRSRCSCAYTQMNIVRGELIALRAAVKAAAQARVVIANDWGEKTIYINPPSGKLFQGRQGEHPADALVRWHAALDHARETKNG